jgi:hypothetical protein
VVGPRVYSVPPFVRSRVDEALEVAERVGVTLDDWQAFVLEGALGVRGDGKWAARDIGACVPRQNGKNAILEIRILAGLLRFGERTIIHSAHELATAVEAQDRLWELVEGTPDLRAIAKRTGTHGLESIRLRGFGRVIFRTRTKGGGRGFGADCVILDEAMDLAERFYGALVPVVSARGDATESGPQIWHTGSAVDQEIHENGVVWARVRERGIAGVDPRLAYFEWSANGEIGLTEEVVQDREAWRRANPALGIRIDEEAVEAELRAMAERTFAVERLGIGDWPSTVVGEASVLDVGKWDALADEMPARDGPITFAFDVRPDRLKAAVAASWRREDGDFHVDIVEHESGTGWLAGRVAELVGRYESAGVWRDSAGPSGAVAAQFDEKRIDVETTTARDLAAACGLLFDLVEQGRLRHSGQPELRAAVRNASVRPLGDAWAWSRRRSTVDISPLVAASIAVWAAARAAPSVYETRGLIVV